MDAPDPQKPTPPILPYASRASAPAPAPPAGAPSALTPENLAQLAAARKLGAGLRRAVLVGKVDGWSIGTFGIITVLCSVGSVPGTILGAGMAILAFYQLRAADALRCLDHKAPANLARNQVLLGILIFAYGGWRLWQTYTDPAAFSTAMGSVDPDVAEMLKPYNELAQSLGIMLYAGVMAVAIIGCGLTAIYYYAQRRRITAYRTATPDWIVALQQTGVMI